MAAETESVAKGGIDLSSLCLVKSQVQILVNFNIRDFKIDRWRHNLIDDSHH